MKKMKIFLFIAVILSVMGLAYANPVRITRSINLVDVWLGSDMMLANDFHIVFKAVDLNGDLIKESYVDSSGYYCSIPGATYTMWVDSADYIHIEWTFPTMCVDISSPASFGFTLLGGMRYEAVDWYWTLDGVRIQSYDDVWQDWIRVGDELQDIIVNRSQMPLAVQRTTGTLNSAVSIMDVVPLVAPPNPVPPEILPIPILPIGGEVIYPWPWPVEDPSYFMFYDLYNADGTLAAVFRNAAVLQEVPDVGEVKWEQKPDLTPNGIDIRVDDGDGVVRHIADDFLCTQTGPITDIHFWGSWMFDEKGQINSIVARIYSDDPVGPGGSNPDNQYSTPDQLLWTGQFYEGEFIESLYHDLTPDFEWWWDPYFGNLIQDGDHQVWKYDIFIDESEAFVQQGSLDNPMVYWLELQVNVNYGMGINFGWKTSSEHWNDDAVFANGAIYPWISGWRELRYPEGHELSPESLDMAFMITTSEGGEPNGPKWEQRPDLNETGIDIDASEPYILADDFNCVETELITKITVWGSWLNDVLPMEMADNVRFTLSIHEDIPKVPDDPMSYSMPGEVKWLYTAEPGTYRVDVEQDNILEGWWSPMDPMSYIFPGDTICWKYTFEIPTAMAFCQEGTSEAPKVYWLDVKAEPLDEFGEARFGWKTSCEHWNDSAVWGVGMEPYMGPWEELLYPMQHQLEMQPIDLAFAIECNEPCPEPQADLGDAPDSSNSFTGMSMTAYPATGVVANFPTVYNLGSPPYGPLHRDPMGAFYLGNGVSFENEADIGCDQDGMNNILVMVDVPNNDDFDDSLASLPYLPNCRMVKFDYDVTVVDPSKHIYANVWFDWNRDGDWDDVSTCCAGVVADEWAVKDQTLSFAAPGTHTVSTPAFRTYHSGMASDGSDIWMRITLSETPCQLSGSAGSVAGGSGPMGGYQYGETEDYYFVPDMSCWSCGDFNQDGIVDGYDLKKLTDNWLWVSTGDSREADLDCDGDIEFIDYAIFADQWMDSCP